MTDETSPLSATDLIRESQRERERVREAIEAAQKAVAEHASKMRLEHDATKARLERARRRPGYAAPP